MNADMKPAFLIALAAFILTLSTTRSSGAQQARTGFGAGAEVTTTGIVGGSFVYDAGMLHLDALLGASFAPENHSTVALAARLFFPVHRVASADFSVGPGLGFVHIDRGQPNPGAPNDTENQFHAEGAFQIRAFVVPNVALSGSAGLGIVAASGGTTVTIGGTVGGSFGITYFFF
jgi:hypothetical protein